MRSTRRSDSCHNVGKSFGEPPPPLVLYICMYSSVSPCLQVSTRPFRTGFRTHRKPGFTRKPRGERVVGWVVVGLTAPTSGGPCIDCSRTCSQHVLESTHGIAAKNHARSAAKARPSQAFLSCVESHHDSPSDSQPPTTVARSARSMAGVCSRRPVPRRRKSGPSSGGRRAASIGGQPMPRQPTPRTGGPRSGRRVRSTRTVAPTSMRSRKMSG